MKYIDTGSRDPSQALGFWLEHVLQDGDVTELRWQSGFYTADGLGFLAPTLERFREESGIVVAVIGSNNGDTLRDDVERLSRLVGIPRGGAQLGIVSYAGSFFHPKTYHLTRRDRSQTAYVGSANLTNAGVGSLHVEAGVVLDTRTGDQQQVLESIGGAIDAWFVRGGRIGLTIIDGPEAIARLAVEGALTDQPPARAQNEAGAGNANNFPPRPRLRALVTVPLWGDREGGTVTEPGGPSSRGEQDAEELEDVIPSDSSALRWDLVWRSKGLSERDLNIPSGENTNATGSIGLRKGDWSADIDHRHYFREDVFASLLWSRDARTTTREVASAVFEVWIDGSPAGETALTISHNTDTTSRTYEQRNEMTHLRWEEARSWVAKRALLGAVLTLYREQNPQGAPKFRISIDRS